MSTVNANGTNGAVTGTFAVKAGLAQMLKGGVIMDVVTAEQARTSPKKLGPVRSWRWNGCPPIFVKTAAWRA